MCVHIFSQNPITAYQSLRIQLSQFSLPMQHIQQLGQWSSAVGMPLASCPNAPSSKLVVYGWANPHHEVVGWVFLRSLAKTSEKMCTFCCTEFNHAALICFSITSLSMLSCAQPHLRPTIFGVEPKCAFHCLYAGCSGILCPRYRNQRIRHLSVLSFQYLCSF